MSQMLTNTIAVVKSLVTFARSPTWVAPQFVGRLAPAGRGTVYTEEQKEKFRNDPEYLKQYRREVDHELNSRFPNFYKGSPAQKLSREIIEQSMREKLAKMDPALREKLIPDFDVGCRRYVSGYSPRLYRHSTPLLITMPVLHPVRDTLRLSKKTTLRLLEQPSKR